jgi:predicted esterase
LTGAGARERHVTVPRTARYYALGPSTSPGGGAPAAREVWVALHGYGQLASHFARHFAPHAAGRLIVVPEALSRFYLESRAGETGPVHGPRVGATWMTREDREAEIADYVRWLDLALDDALDDARDDALGGAATGLTSPPLCVLAFSQGTATACRWLQARAGRGARPAARLVLWAGTLPPDLDLAAEWLRQTRLTLVVGTEDPFVTAAALDEIVSRLTAHGVECDTVSYTGGHRIEPDVLARIMT